MRRIGVLMTLSEDDAEGRERMAAFRQSLQQLGWSDGSNVKIDYRWGANDADRIKEIRGRIGCTRTGRHLTAGTLSVAVLQQATRTVPIVFGSVIDPVGAGFVETLARPGGNITGFTVFEYGISPKWLELLKQIAPHVTRAAVLRDPTVASGTGQLGEIQGGRAVVWNRVASDRRARRRRY